MNNILFDSTIENFEDAILELEQKLLNYSNRPDCSVEYVEKQKRLIESIKLYSIQSQQYMFQLERKAPINNYISHNTNVFDNSDYELKKENKELKKEIEKLKSILYYHGITQSDMEIIITHNFGKETIRQISIFKNQQEMPQLY